MDHANKLTCPNCGTVLKSQRGVRIGRKIKCLACEVAFTVRPEDAEQAAGVNPTRLGLVLIGALFYLLGGASLAYYCFAQNARHQEASPVGPVTQAKDQVAADDNQSESSLPTPPPQLPAVSAAEQRPIDDAIARGVWFLKDHTLPAGTWGEVLPADGQSHVEVGFASLPALTLLECGVPTSDPIVQKAAAYVRQQGPPAHAAYDTYQRALAILFLDRLGEKKDEELIQYLALCLIAGQHPTEGAWSYYCPVLDRKRVPQLLKQLQNPKLTLDAWRKAALNKQPFEIEGWDNSNTQFAILALWVAQRHHVSIDRSITLAEKHFRSTQLPDGPDPKGDNQNLGGSWYYNAGENSSAWPSMTCAGLLALAEAHAVTGAGEQKPQTDPAIQRGLAMLAREIDRDGEKRGPDLYFLWSLERVGVLYNLPKIGGKDWYAWGRKVLLPRQQPDGNWQDGGYYGNAPVLDTCFALLFLKQANLAKDLSSKLQLLQKK